MARRFFTILSVLSLILCIATTAQWLRSFWWSDYFVYHVTPTKTYQFASADGRCCWAVVETIPAPKRERPLAMEEVRVESGGSGLVGSIVSPDGSPIGVHHTEGWYRKLSYEWVMLLLAILPVTRKLLTVRARSRHAARLACGQVADSET